MTSTSWQPFNYNEPFDCELCWVYGTYLESDCDANDSGQTVGCYTEKNTLTAKGLAIVEFDPENGMYIEWFFGDMEIEDPTFFLTHFIRLDIPNNPILDNNNDS